MWLKYENYFSNYLHLLRSNKTEGLPYFRDKLFISILLITFPLGLLAYIPSMIFSLLSDEFAIAFGDSVAMLIVSFILFYKNYSLLTKKILFSINLYILALVLLLFLGVKGPGVILFISVTILSTLYISKKAGLISLAFVAATYFFLIFGFQVESFDLVFFKELNTSNWIVISLNLIIFNTILVLAVSFLVDQLQNSILTEHKLQKQLKQESKNLREMNLHKEALLELSKKLEFTKTYDEIGDAAVIAIKKITEYKGLALCMLSEFGDSITYESFNGSILKLSELGIKSISIKENQWLKETLTTETISIMENAETDPRSNKEIVKIFENKTIINIPMHIKNSMIGYISTGTWGKEGFKSPTKSDLNFFISMTPHIAIAINRLIISTQRKKAEEKLIKLSTAVRQSPSIIVITDLEGNIEYANPKFTETTGYKFEEIENKKTKIHEFSYFSGHIFNELWETISSGKEWHGEFHSKKENGDLYWERALISPIFDHKNKIINYLKIAEDITEQKKIESELLKMEKLKSIGTLAGGIAHDFNNILTGIYGNISLALMKLEENHQSSHYLTRAENSLNRATQLTKQLLTFSKGGNPIKRDENLSEIIKETVVFDLSGSNVKPIFNFADNLYSIKVDKGQLQQVFSNLAINANQASPNGGHLYISIVNSFVNDNEILDLASGKYLKITVQDEGTGIPQKHIDKIFEPYFTTKPTGNGLGLATTYSIIKKHKGHLEIDSELGKGTKFTLYLPASKKGEVKKEEKSETSKLPENNTAKILIMDDEESIREILSQMIELLGYKTDAVSDGEEAINKYREAKEQGNPFDIIIMDLTIPGGMGGKEAVKEILKIDKDAKVIVSSGYASGATLADYKSFGFIDMINKPYTIAKLGEVLNRVMNNLKTS